MGEVNEPAAGSVALVEGRPTPVPGQDVPVVSRKYTVLMPLLPLPFVKYTTLLLMVLR